MRNQKRSHKRPSSHPNPMSTQRESKLSQPPEPLPQPERGQFSIIPWLAGLLQFCRQNRIPLGFVAVIGATSIGLSQATGRSAPPPPPQQTAAHQQLLLTQLQYERLERGMTLTEAQSTIGPATEISRDETTVTYKWTTTDGATIIAVFRNNRLVSKRLPQG